MHEQASSSDLSSCEQTFKGILGPVGAEVESLGSRRTANSFGQLAPSHRASTRAPARKTFVVPSGLLGAVYTILCTSRRAAERQRGAEPLMGQNKTR